MENAPDLLIQLHFFQPLWCIFSGINFKSIIAYRNRPISPHEEYIRKHRSLILICRHPVICLFFSGCSEIIISDSRLYNSIVRIKIADRQHHTVICHIKGNRIACRSKRDLLLYKNIACRIIRNDLRRIFIFQDCTYNTLIRDCNLFNRKCRFYLTFQSVFREYHNTISASVCHGKCILLYFDHRRLDLRRLDPHFFILFIQIDYSIPVISYDSFCKLYIIACI